MKVLVVDIYNNGLFAAHKLANQYPLISKVILVSEFVRTSMWESEKLTIVQDRMSVDDIVSLAKKEEVDLVINFSSLYGKGGLKELLADNNIDCVGSGKKFSETETNKRLFRYWVKEKGFKSPDIIFEGYYDDVIEKCDDLSYPLVIKPDSQIGPTVQPCFSPEDLRNYLVTTIERVPYARNAILFMLEEFIPLLDELYVTYFVCGGEVTIWETNRLPHSWKSRRDAGECAYALVPNPNFEPYKAEITRYLSEFKELADNTVGIVQCGVAEDRSLYFIESNARPPTAAFGMFDDPLSVLVALRDGDSATLTKSLSVVDSSGAAIALMHHADSIEVDVELLSGLEGFSYWPNSVEKEDGLYRSYKRGAPSFLYVYGSTIEEVVTKLSQNLHLIEQAGDFLKIIPQSIVDLYEGQGGAAAV